MAGQEVKCQFPFVDNGSVFYGCAESTTGQLWCSTKRDEKYQHVSGHYGLCKDKSCLIDEPKCTSSKKNFNLFL